MSKTRIVYKNNSRDREEMERSVKVCEKNPFLQHLNIWFFGRILKKSYLLWVGPSGFQDVRGTFFLPFFKSLYFSLVKFVFLWSAGHFWVSSPISGVWKSPQNRAFILFFVLFGWLSEGRCADRFTFGVTWPNNDLISPKSWPPPSHSA